MVNSLYYFSDLVYAFVLLVILFRDLRIKTDVTKAEKAFRTLLKWVIFFCVQDAFWGFSGSVHGNSTAFFVASTIFHFSTVSTTFVWLYYVLIYLSPKVRNKHIFLIIDGIVIACQSILLVINIFHPTIFYIENGIYITAFLRPLAFFNQYIVYFLIALISGLVAFATTDATREKYITVFISSLAPVFFGFFQLIDPNGPFYSMGYFLGCFLIHIFVVTKDREELIQLQNEKLIAYQVKLANTDELTELENRHAYENYIKSNHDIPIEQNFSYFSVDINGLKATNDTLGHAAGDELIKAAADCLKICLGSYGKVFRIGGDEFAAIIFADYQTLEFLKKDLTDTALHWRGRLVNELSLSVGVATKDEFHGFTISELAKAADERMYEAKAKYYERTGFDRRGQIIIK